MFGEEQRIENDDTPKRAVRPAFVVALVVAAVVLIVFSGSIMRELQIDQQAKMEDQAAKRIDQIYQKVAADAVAQYDITKRNGNAIDICVHAGMVAAAYLQAQDEPNYKKWKDTEAADCRSAGMPK